MSDLVMQLIEASLIFIGQRLEESLPLVMAAGNLEKVAVLVGHQTIQQLLRLAVINCSLCG